MAKTGDRRTEQTTNFYCGGWGGKREARRAHTDTDPGWLRLLLRPASQGRIDPPVRSIWRPGRGDGGSYTATLWTAAAAGFAEGNTAPCGESLRGSSMCVSDAGPLQRSAGPAHVRSAHTLLTVITLPSGPEGVVEVVTEGGFLALALAFRCCLIIWWTSFRPK